MERIEYTEYQDVVKPEDQEISVIVQIPKDETYPVHVIIQSGRRWLRYSLAEWSGINNIVLTALHEAGWEETSSKEKKVGRDYGHKGEDD